MQKSCITNAKAMHNSCKSHAKLMQNSCITNAKVMQKSCKTNAKLMQNSSMLDMRVEMGYAVDSITCQLIKCLGAGAFYAMLATAMSRFCRQEWPLLSHECVVHTSS